jgi:hypothetical protein
MILLWRKNTGVNGLNAKGIMLSRWNESMTGSDRLFVFLAPARFGGEQLLYGSERPNGEDRLQRRTVAMWGTTPPCEITTSPSKRFNLKAVSYDSSGKQRPLTLHRFGWQAEGDGERYAAFYYREQRFQRAQESRQRDIQEQRQDTL